MDVSVISSVKVNLPSPASMKPFKLSLMDQLFKKTLYTPLILFYNPPNTPVDFAAQLKTSLAETLLPFYPIAGSTLDNVYIDQFNTGVRFIETRVENISNVSSYLRRPRIDTLNMLLPCETLKELVSNPPEEQVLVQLNHFDCGGIALGLCLAHKIIDGATLSAFLKTWATYNTRLHFPSSEKEHRIKHPDLLTTSQLFPPKQGLEPIFPRDSEQKIRKIRRFVFSVEDVKKLRLIGKSRAVENPSRTEVLTAFIWKSLVSGSAKTSMMCVAVNMRGRTRPHLPKNALGNLIRLPILTHDNNKEMEIGELVRLQRDMISNMSKDDIILPQQSKRNTPDVEFYLCTSWIGFGFHEIDFGWGKPAWVGFSGFPRSNLICLKELGGNTKALEAWIALEEEKMSILENDPEFLAFATPNPSIKLLD